MVSAAGAHWHERGVGTNALGTTLICAEAVHVGQDEHFLRQNRYMSSAAAPCSTPHGSWSGRST